MAPEVAIHSEATGDVVDLAAFTRPEAQRSAVPGDAPAVFHVSDLSVRYGAFRAVRDVSMEVQRGEITAFIGPSGCGKSTVLRCCNRMNDPIPNARIDGGMFSRGIDVYGDDVEPVEVCRRIGMVFQKPNPFPKSIFDNVAYGPRIAGNRNKADLAEIVEGALRKAALWNEVKDRLVSPGTGLSGGQ